MGRGGGRVGPGGGSSVHLTEDERVVGEARGWQQLQDARGRVYFHNGETGATTWERPAALSRDLAWRELRARRRDDLFIYDAYHTADLGLAFFLLFQVTCTHFASRITLSNFAIDTIRCVCAESTV